MSNAKERRELEELIIREFETLQSVLAYNGHTLANATDWSEGTWQTWCRFMGLRDAAKVIGMGEYDTSRCQRIINGTQYGKESYA